jgi:hypothetical protein
MMTHNNQILSFKTICFINDAPPNSLIDSTMSPKVKTMEGKRARVLSLTHNTSGVKEHVGTPGWGLG